MKYKSNLGKILKHIRVYNRETCLGLSKKLELTQSYITHLEQSNKTPSLKTLNKYAKFAGVPVSAIILFAEQYNDKNQIKKKAKNLVCKSAKGLLNWIFENDY